MLDVEWADRGASLTEKPRLRIPPLLLLGIAVTLLAATAAVVKWLQVQSLVVLEPHAISFCNVLFVGNLIAGLVALFTFGPRGIARDLGQASGRTRGVLLLNTLVAVAIPSLMFAALARTSVTNLVLLGRFESVAFAVFATVFLGHRIRRGEWASYGVIVVGMLTLVLAQGMFQLNRGDLLVIGVAILQGAAAILAKRTLESCTLTTFVFVRNFGSALVFLVIGLRLFGWEHFMHAFGPRLWLAMSVYALVIIVIGQLAWYRSIKDLPPSTVARVTLVSPGLGILFAWLLLGEVPAGTQWVGGGIILLGLALTQVGAGAPRAVTVDESLAGGYVVAAPRP